MSPPLPNVLFNTPEMVYPTPFFSKDSDIPSRPIEFGGKRFAHVGDPDSIENLKPFPSMRCDVSRHGLRDSLINGMRTGCSRIRSSLTASFVVEPILAPPNPAGMWQDHFNRLRHEKKKRKKTKQSHLGVNNKVPASPGGYERPSATDLMLDLPRHAN